MPPKGSRTTKSTGSDSSMATITEPTISNSADSDSDSTIEPAQRASTLGSNLNMMADNLPQPTLLITPHHAA